MATKVASTAKDVAVKSGPNFRVGQKQVFLPAGIVKMLPPKRVFSPYFATFQVPLRFNKLDLRDYLYHAYGVEVRAVRSWLTARQPRRRTGEDDGAPNAAGGGTPTRDLVAFGRGAWYRPQPIKRMMVELVKPFAFPAAPVDVTKTGEAAVALATEIEDDPRKDWDAATMRRMLAQQAVQLDNQRRMAHDQVFRLHEEEEHVPAFRVELAREARALVRGERAWQPNSREAAVGWDAKAAAAAGSSSSSSGSNATGAAVENTDKGSSRS